MDRRVSEKVVKWLENTIGWSDEEQEVEWRPDGDLKEEIYVEIQNTDDFPQDIWYLSKSRSMCMIVETSNFETT